MFYTAVANANIWTNFGEKWRRLRLYTRSSVTDSFIIICTTNVAFHSTYVNREISITTYLGWLNSFQPDVRVKSEKILNELDFGTFRRGPTLLKNNNKAISKYF